MRGPEGASGESPPPTRRSTGEPSEGDRGACEAGVVRAVLPNGRYEVELTGGRRVCAHRGRSARMDLVRVIGGTRVEVEVLGLDPNRARIVGLAGPE